MYMCVPVMCMHICVSCVNLCKCGSSDLGRVPLAQSWRLISPSHRVPPIFALSKYEAPKVNRCAALVRGGAQAVCLQPLAAPASKPGADAPSVV